MKILEKSLNLNLANFVILHLLTIFFWRSFKALVGLRRRQLLREAARAFAEAAACGESGLTARHVDQSCPWVGLTHGLGWVGLVRVGSRFFSFWWVGLCPL